MYIVLWVKPLYSLKLYEKLFTSWFASIRVVFRLNFRLHITNRSSMVGPNRSITIRFDLNSFPCQWTLENPIPPSKFFNILAYANSWGCLDFSSSCFGRCVLSWEHRLIRCRRGWQGRLIRMSRFRFWDLRCIFQLFCLIRTPFV